MSELNSTPAPAPNEKAAPDSIDTVIATTRIEPLATISPPPGTKEEAGPKAEAEAEAEDAEAEDAEAEDAEAEDAEAEDAKAEDAKVEPEVEPEAEAEAEAEDAPEEAKAEDAKAEDAKAEDAKRKKENHNAQTQQSYVLKHIRWRDPWTGHTLDKQILTQNQNGPCPLIALTNVLILQNKLQIPTNSSVAEITADALASLLGNFLLAQDGVSEETVALVLGLLPSMSRGLDVELRFANIYDFAEPSGATAVFRAFGVVLVHGWVAEGSALPVVAETLHLCGGSYQAAAEYVFAADEMSHGQVLGQNHSYNSMHENRPPAVLSPEEEDRVGRALALNAWLEDTATQLTGSGLRMLQHLLPEPSLAVFFRNNHFSTLFRRSQQGLFMLCTDEAVAADTRVVWESLADVHQSGSAFFDAAFCPIDPRGGGKGKDADYAREEVKEDTANVDDDYAFALELERQQQEEEDLRRKRQLQVRQQDRMPPGMNVGRRSKLYAVPEVTKAAAAAAAEGGRRPMGRSRSEESFERRMADAFLPHEPATVGRKNARDGEQQRQQQQQRRRDEKATDSGCIIC
ncbi:hypothetical protein LPJ66_007267 [Kickxella alabastrina]|uniref:Uncharacterized protein n=1 Tax=Kickxella alabastrina TaxID=61397 RepID=A0ACC1IBU8_9FUNG|nr:hypothetical protein LPJ66_007267 [Kickxella alabastrina]